MEIISSDYPQLSRLALHSAFTQLLEESSAHKAQYWFEGLTPRTRMLSPVFFKDFMPEQPFSLGATMAGGFLWLFWRNGLLPDLSAASTTQTSRPQEPQPWELDPEQTLLLEELSRVNNELVNARRELIRHNIELHRAHRKLNESSS